MNGARTCVCVSALTTPTANAIKLKITAVIFFWPDIARCIAAGMQCSRKQWCLNSLLWRRLCLPQNFKSRWCAGGDYGWASAQSLRTKTVQSGLYPKWSSAWYWPQWLYNEISYFDSYTSCQSPYKHLRRTCPDADCPDTFDILTWFDFESPQSQALLSWASSICRRKSYKLLLDFCQSIQIIQINAYEPYPTFESADPQLDVATTFFPSIEL